MANFTDRELGNMEARIALLEKELGEVRKDTRKILTTLSEAQGGWKTLMMLSGFSATLGAFISQIFIYFPR
tara:strand:- start:462 stop:674 length:213 start_codon:yes stop_codon:yes gene_type:complete